MKQFRATFAFHHRKSRTLIEIERCPGGEIVLYCVRVTKGPVHPPKNLLRIEGDLASRPSQYTFKEVFWYFLLFTQKQESTAPDILKPQVNHPRRPTTLVSPSTSQRDGWGTQRSTYALGHLLILPVTLREEMKLPGNRGLPPRSFILATSGRQSG